MHLQVLVVKVQQNLIPAFVLGLDTCVFQIAPTASPISNHSTNPSPSSNFPLQKEHSPGSHPAVHLVAKGLNVALHGKFFLKLLYGFRVLVFGCKHAEGHLDALGVGGVDHGRVDFCDSREGGVGLGG